MSHDEAIAAASGLLRDGADSMMFRCIYGHRYWYRKDTIGSRAVPHREDGPAVEYDNGEKVWLENGLEVRAERMRT